MTWAMLVNGPVFKMELTGGKAYGTNTTLFGCILRERPRLILTHTNASERTGETQVNRDAARATNGWPKLGQEHR